MKIFNRNRFGEFSSFKVRANAWASRQFKKGAIVFAVIAVLGIYTYAVDSGKVIAYIKGDTVIVEKEVKVIPPILKKIAIAESWDSHYCTKEIANKGGCRKSEVGQVLVNDTKDVGRYAINLMYNGKFCADKGLNVFDEKQNEECALALFYERGSEPWSASKHNWNK